MMLQGMECGASVANHEKKGNERGEPRRTAVAMVHCGDNIPKAPSNALE